MKGYLVLDLSIKVLEGFLEYAEKIPTFIDKHGGRYIVQGVVPEKMEGNWSPERLVILEFPSTEKAKEFLADPEAQELFSLRHKTTNSQLILAEGCIQ
ncbi:DUF1330 domain-containing protein [Teredinibacter turnerae]|uniref:DUF1330 domain-containing protein n=1 Tax=Teredinibacter turnerae TaxID=2426 RepID=UPI0003648E1E|nr:DUF1330 domain-containing protein [Teredinibacter turnerae]